ncbi:c-type cytochrome [Variovorax sp. GB1P17]|uniref:c-type cytochrome n=1 Tax=Variovorax sp. GB1P17 TaxID=3443740 RepID=UPI003F47A5EB
MAAHKLLPRAAATLLLLAACAAASAADSTSLGRVATHEEVAGWNIDVFVNGAGLPAGSGTVKAGEQVYRNACLGCHGAKLEGGLGPALTGGAGTLRSAKPLKTVASYWPYATTLFDYIRRAMPFQAPQSLTNDEVYSVTAYILNFNAIVPSDATMDRDSLPKVKMPNRNSFYVDDRPDAKNLRCMKNCKTASAAN